jgi:hypothetical protein
MSDLISRQAAIDELTENKEMINAVLDSLTLDYNTRRNQEQRRGQINEDIETIKALPSAQPEPTLEQIEEYCHKRCLSIVDNALLHKYVQAGIIRCKDCKHLQKLRSEESAKKFGQIYECARNVFDCPKPEDFCSHAERKE